MKKETFEEFKVKVTRAREKKDYKIKNSWGVYDTYKALRKKGWLDIGRPVTEWEFYAIVRGINRYLANEIAMGKTITFPAKMGRLELRKFEVGASIVNNKLKVTYPIDWPETFKLWYEDPEAMRDKLLMRDDKTKYSYYVKYCTYDATYENKSFYQFRLNTFIKRALRDNVKAGKVDTPWEGRYQKL